MAHFIGISGKDSCATALLQKTIAPDLEYIFFHNETGVDYPETLDWLNKVEAALGSEIVRVNGNLPAIIRGYQKTESAFLPSIKARYCTRESKIEPMEQFFGAYHGEKSVYYGLRYDERQRVGYVPIAGSEIKPKYPLIDYQIDLRGVYSILAAQNLLPPSFRWQRLEDAVHAEVSFLFPDWRERMEPWELDVLLCGRTRPNCYFCFNQSAWEFIWLLEIHPDLYDDAATYEKPGYSWLQGFPLEEFKKDIKRQDRIFEMRVQKVCKIIFKRLLSSTMEFEESELALTSCGLLCGK